MEKVLATNSEAYPTFTVSTDIDKSADDILRCMAEANERVSALRMMRGCSVSAGNYVKFLPELSLIPTFIGHDGSPVFLYQLVELLDEIIDYDLLIQEYANLNYGQLGSFFSFLKKILQLNAKNLDVEEFENDFYTQSPAFIEALRTALQEESVNVYSVDQ